MTKSFILFLSCLLAVSSVTAWGQEKYTQTFAALEAFHLETTGDAEEIKRLKEFWNPDVYAKALTRLASDCLNSDVVDDVDQAKVHLAAAEPIMKSGLKTSSRTAYFDGILLDFVSAKSKLGEHKEALNLIRQHPTPQSSLS